MELDEQGTICDCNAAGTRFFGFDPDHLRGAHGSRVFPGLAAGDLLSEGRVNPRFAFLRRCGVPLEGVRSSGERVAVAVATFARRNGGPVRVMLTWHVARANVQPFVRARSRRETPTIRPKYGYTEGQPEERGKQRLPERPRRPVTLTLAASTPVQRADGTAARRPARPD
jgi:PAS domain-containing protein